MEQIVNAHGPLFDVSEGGGGQHFSPHLSMPFACVSRRRISRAVLAIRCTLLDKNKKTRHIKQITGISKSPVPVSNIRI